MKPFPPRNWHYKFMSEADRNREINLIRWCVLKIDPQEPVAVSGFNAFVVIQKMAEQLNDYESKLLMLLDLQLPDGRTVHDLFVEWVQSQRPVGSTETGIDPEDLLSRLNDFLIAQKGIGRAMASDGE